MLFSQRYMYYVINGVQSDMVAAHSMQQMANIQKRAPNWFQSDSQEVLNLHSQLKEEILEIYNRSLKKSIGEKLGPYI